MNTVTLELTLEQLATVRIAIDTECLRLEQSKAAVSHERRAILATVYPIIEEAFSRGLEEA